MSINDVPYNSILYVLYIKKGGAIVVVPSAIHFSTPHAKVDTGKTWHLQRRAPGLRMEELGEVSPAKYWYHLVI